MSARPYPVRLFSPYDIRDTTSGPSPFFTMGRKLLVMGDSWFSFGDIPPTRTANLLDYLTASVSAGAINCAMPGNTLKHAVDMRRDVDFFTLLSQPNFDIAFDGLLLSMGGNDLIDAMSVTPVDPATGKLRDTGLRLLLTPAETGNSTKASDYGSAAGWDLFTRYLTAQYHEVVAMRDSAGSKSQGVPIFVHTYDYMTPRPAGTTIHGVGPWVQPTLANSYKIAQPLWIPIARLLLDKLADLLAHMHLPNFVAINTLGTLAPAALNSGGTSGDWANEIHATPGGFRKLAGVVSKGMEDWYAAHA